MTLPRKCFYIPVVQFDEHGYIPSLVTEGEAGHAPLTGNGRFARPWYWGKTYEEAEKFAEAENRRVFDLSPEETAEIVVSSMAASAGWRRWQS